MTQAERFVFLHIPGQGLPVAYGICRGKSPPRANRGGPTLRVICTGSPCPTIKHRHFELWGSWLESITDGAVVVRIEGRIIDPEDKERDMAVSDLLDVPIGEERVLRLDVGPLRVKYMHAG